MDISGIALMALLFVAGAQTPLLALLALRRRRTLLVVLGPYAVLVPLALALAPALDEPARIGLLALAVAPAELAAPGLAPLIRARLDTTGAYVAGTVVLSFALTLAFMGSAGQAALGVVRDAAFAFLVGMTFAGALPMWRDRVLPLLRRLGDLALVVLIGTAILRGAPALSGTAALLALLVLAVGAGAALAAARLGGGDRWSALAVSGHARLRGRGGDRRRLIAGGGGAPARLRGRAHRCRGSARRAAPRETWANVGSAVDT